MAFPGLPSLYTVSDAASFDLTVRPYLHEFWSFRDVLYGSRSFSDYYLTTNPVVVSAQLCVAWIAFTWLASEVTGNYSWVDRAWSLIPTSHAIHYFVRAWLTGAGKNGLVHARLALITGLYCLWSIRLTRNYYRKGGYSRGHQDYRWTYIRQTLPRPVFFFVHMLVNAVFHNVLLAWLATPVYIALLIGRETPLTWRDAVIVELFIFSLTGQLLADDQQLRYQECKIRHAEFRATLDDTYREFTPRELERGFLTRGLWRWSRHPAFALEQIDFGLLYLMGTLATVPHRHPTLADLQGVVLNWTSYGFLALVALFQLSTRLTEWLSSKKYPDQYRLYQARVGMLLPLPGYAWEEAPLTAEEKQRLEELLSSESRKAK